MRVIRHSRKIDDIDFLSFAQKVDGEEMYMREFLKIKEPFDHNSLKQEPFRKQFSIS
jgi:hypothetical protein